MKRSKLQLLNLPSRWLNCPNKGNVVNDLFIPFKTPLDEQYDLEMNPDRKFNLKIFLSSKESKKVGMIINLTKTERYYDANQLKTSDILFERIPCEGHEGPPSHEQVQHFIDVCSDFFVQQKGSYIGVHCTHGFNRTGFMIISFLCDIGLELDHAVELFATARPPGIYKEDYLVELIVRHRFKKNIFTPEKPNWCFDDSKTYKDVNFIEDSFNLSDDEDKSMNQNMKHKRVNKPKHTLPKIPVFMEGVTGVTPVTDDTVIEEVTQKVCELMNTKKKGFVGSQPVSLTQENIKLLTKNEYLVSWKADGTRYLMLIADKDMVYMFDRDNCVYKVDNINFVKDTSSYYANTLVDGEMVIDIYQGRKFPRFLIYDIMNLEEKYVGNKPFAVRMGLIKNQLIDTRNKYLSVDLKQKESFGIRIKDFWPIHKTQEIYEGKFRKELCHEMDGLIYQPAGPDDGYIQGRCNTMFKWKPPHLNSIDFHLRCEYVKEKDLIPMYVGFLTVSGSKSYFAKIDNIKKNLREKYNNKIVECTYDLKTNKWEIMRERTDKSMPNHISTAQSVYQNIFQPVHLKNLYDVINYRTNHSRSFKNK